MTSRELHELTPLIREFYESYRRIRELPHRERTAPIADLSRELVREAEKFLSRENFEVFEKAYSR